MPITYLDKTKTFKLDTPNTTYMFRIVDDEGFILHLYYGRRLTDENIDDLARIEEPPFVPSKNNRDRGSFMDCAPFEYPGHGLGDYRDDAFSVINEEGYSATSINYKSYKILPGKPKLPGLPATFANTNKNIEQSSDKQNSICNTLEITAEDSANGLEIILSYSVFEDVDAIARSVRVRNTGKYQNIKLTKVLSASYEFYGDDYDTIFMHGTWARERNIDREHLGYGKHYVSSTRGESSHQEHPFIALLSSDANEDYGDVYGFSFVYSGNFIAQAERSQFDNVRVTMGISPVDFCWNLKAGEEFCTPEVISVYSDAGLGKMSRNFHDLYRNHLIRSPYKDMKRPILINNWEATYFNFDTE